MIIIIIQKALIELGENCQGHRFLIGSSRFESGIFCQSNEKNTAKTAERRKAEKGLDSVDPNTTGKRLTAGRISKVSESSCHFQSDRRKWMGVKDITANAFLADNKRFADVCNYYLYNGEDVIRPEELLEQDVREI